MSTYQLFQLSCGPVVLDSALLDNHSHKVTAIDSKGMSKTLISEGLSLGFHPGTTLVYAHGHRADRGKKDCSSLHNKFTKCAYLTRAVCQIHSSSFLILFLFFFWHVGVCVCVYVYVTKYVSYIMIVFGP